MSFVVHQYEWNLMLYKDWWQKPGTFTFEVPAAMSPLEEE